jgi:hypothetical protein
LENGEILTNKQKDKSKDMPKNILMLSSGIQRNELSLLILININSFMISFQMEKKRDTNIYFVVYIVLEKNYKDPHTLIDLFIDQCFHLSFEFVL